MTATVPSITFRYIHQKMDLTPCLVLYRGGYLPGISILEQGNSSQKFPSRTFGNFHGLELHLVQAQTGHWHEKWIALIGLY